MRVTKICLVGMVIASAFFKAVFGFEEVSCHK